MTSWIAHLFFYVTGARNLSGTAYGLMSGFGSDLGEITLLGAALAVYKRFTCHTWWCPRHARYELADEQTGISYRLCGRCHPQHPGKRLTRKHIARIHARNRAGKAQR